MNQCIHNLDIFQWLCGMPGAVRAFCRFGQYHDIEVEDEVTALTQSAQHVCQYIDAARRKDGPKPQDQVVVTGIANRVFGLAK